MKKLLLILVFLMGINIFTMEIEEKKYKVQGKYTIISGNIPIFKAEEKVVSNEAVAVFETLADMVIMESKRYFIEEKKTSTNNFVLKSDYKKMKNNMGVDSYLIKTYYYTGGSHGMMMETPYNFIDGRKALLNEFFKENVNYQTIIKNKVEEIIIEDNPSHYYDTVTIKEEGYKFYFSEDKLVIIFDVYEIGPFESGILSFDIPISELEGYLK